MFSFYLLRYFLSVVETGSFTKASIRCHVTQPTLSAGIRKLEEEIGHVLFERSNRRVELTDAGARFLVHAERILADYSLATMEMSQSIAATRIRVGVPYTVPSRAISAINTALSAGVGEHQIEILEGNQQELVNRLAQGRLDFALIARREPPEEAVLWHQTESYRLMLSERHPLASSPLIRAEELARENMIVRRRCEVLSEVSRHFTVRGVRPPLAMRTYNDATAIDMVRDGLGMTVMPVSFQAEGVACSELQGFDTNRHLTWVSGNSDVAASSEVGEVMVSHFEQFFSE